MGMAKDRCRLFTRVHRPDWKEPDMNSQLETAKARLFGEEGLRAADIKLYPGSSRDASPEMMAEQVNNVLAQLERGEYEVIESFDD